MHGNRRFQDSHFDASYRTTGVELPLMFVLAMAAVLGQAALFPRTAQAQTVTFTYNLTCVLGAPGCPNSNLEVSDQVGGIASDVVGIATVNSDVPGFTAPVPISGGILTWVSTPATRALCALLSGSVLPDYDCSTTYGNPGGSTSVTGAVFGLPSGSTLLKASFQGGATSEYIRPYTQWFEGAIDIPFINPTILANLGMAGLPNIGTGTL